MAIPAAATGPSVTVTATVVPVVQGECTHPAPSVDNKLKKPGPAFKYFSNHKREGLRTEFPEMTYTQISSKLGEMWRALNDEEREPYWEQHYQDSDRCNEQRAAKGLVPIGKTPQQRQEEQEREKLKEEKKALRELDSAQKQKDKEARAILKEEERVRKANKLEEAQVQREKEKTDKAAQKEEERLQKLEERKRNHNSETGRKTKKRKQSDDDAEDVYEVEQVLDKRTQVFTLGL